MKRYVIIILLFVILLMAPVLVLCAESRVRVKGLVRDKVTREPVPYATVSLTGTQVSGLTNDKGVFELYTSQPFKDYVVTAFGYAPGHLSVQKANALVVIELVPEGLSLGEVSVKGQKKKKYSKKNNPAVEFMERIRKDGDKTDPMNEPEYNYDVYETIKLGINDFHPEENKGLLKHFKGLEAHTDTSAVTGKPFLSLATREKRSTFRHSQQRGDLSIVKGLRQAGLDDLGDVESMRRFYEDVMREVDLYENDIPLMQNRFVSPLSRIAPDFYKFFLTDTLAVGRDTCIVLTFVPHNPQMFGFTGSLYVLKDDPSMFVKRAALRVNPAVNLNYVRNIWITQEFDRSPNGKRLKTLDHFTMEAEVIPGAAQIFSERRSEYFNHSFEALPDDTISARGAREVIAPEAYTRSDEYWCAQQPTETIKGHQNTKALMEKLRENKVFYWSEKILRILINGYIPTSSKSKFDFGPVPSTFSYNDLEGSRFRLGGMTTANLSKHLFMKGYGAYGLKDKRWKYSGEVEYSFNEKKYHAREFPVKSIAASYSYDINKLGQNFINATADNLFFSISRHKDQLINYKRRAELKYTLELTCNFSVTAKAWWERQYDSPFIEFVTGNGEQMRGYNESGLTVQLRYAPGETFYQGRSVRVPINGDAPVITLSHTYTPRGFLGSRFGLNITEASVMKRFWFSSWGYTDIMLKGGHAWNVTPFPQLLIPNANLSYTVQEESFALMNPMEFVNDSYASWEVTYFANGALLNYIPLVKKLKLREVFSFRGIWGDLSTKNNPAYNPNTFRFPALAEVTKMRRMPYMEVGVGIENILTFLRVDYVWRLSYRDTPGVSRSGIQVGAHFTF